MNLVHQCEFQSTELLHFTVHLFAKCLSTCEGFVLVHHTQWAEGQNKHSPATLLGATV